MLTYCLPVVYPPILIRSCALHEACAVICTPSRYLCWPMAYTGTPLVIRVVGSISYD